MPIMDPFSTSGFFELADLAGIIDEIPYQPGQIGRMRLFQEEGLLTPRVRLERRRTPFELVSIQDRTAPIPAYVPPLRQAISVDTYRIARQHLVTVDALLTVRQWATDGQQQDVQAWIRSILEEMARKIDATIEHLMLGALRGYTIDSDGSVVLNHYSVMGVTPPTEVGLNLASATTTQLATAVQGIVHAIREAVGAPAATRTIALCGRDFWAQFVTHEGVRTSYERAFGIRELAMQPGGWLAEGRVTRPQTSFHWQGIEWTEYEGGATSVLEHDKALVFPDLAGLYKIYYAPADFLGGGGRGRPRYARALPQTPDGRGIPLEVSSYPLALCTQPQVLRRVRAGA